MGEVVLTENNCEESAQVNGAPKPGSFGQIAKLILILGSYIFLFHTLVSQARWFLTGSVEGEEAAQLLDWLRCQPGCDPNFWMVLKGLAQNALLFTVFMAQHTLLTERCLSGTFFYQKVFKEWKINGSLYSFTTAVALNILMAGWRPVPVYIWYYPAAKPVISYVHMFAWLMLYGTTLMQDMPELIGLNQVVISNASTSRKSPEFKAMLNGQRHLGLVPFFIITITSEAMTIDRLLFVVICCAYSYTMWRNPVGFMYIKSMMDRKREDLSVTRKDE